MRKYLTLSLLVAAELALGPHTTMAQGLPGGAAAASFIITRNGDQIGTSTVRVQRRGDETIVETTTDIRVTFAAITFYRFAKRQTEHWAGGAFTGLSSVTDEDGKVTRVTATRNGDHLSINVDGKVHDAEVAPPANWWDPSVLRLTRALDTNDGAIIPMSVTDRGEEQIVVRGRAIAAHHYTIKMSGSQDAWYDKQQRLVRLELRGSDGSTIIHEPN